MTLDDKWTAILELFNKTTEHGDSAFVSWLFSSLGNFDKTNADKLFQWCIDSVLKVDDAVTESSD